MKKSLAQLVDELRAALNRKEKWCDPTPPQLSGDILVEERKNWSEQDWADHFADIEFERWRDEN